MLVEKAKPPLHVVGDIESKTCIIVEGIINRSKLVFWAYSRYVARSEAIYWMRNIFEGQRSEKRYYYGHSRNILWWYNTIDWELLYRSCDYFKLSQFSGPSEGCFKGTFWNEFVTPYINVYLDSSCWYLNSLIRSNPSNPFWRIYELYVQRCSIWRLNQYQCSMSVVAWQAITTQLTSSSLKTLHLLAQLLVLRRNCSELFGFEIDPEHDLAQCQIFAVLPDWLFTLITGSHRNLKFTNSNILHFRMILLFLIGLVSGFYLPGLAPVSYCPKGTW